MTINFNCPHCQKPLKVKEELGGKKAKCPRCQKALVIPEPTPTVPQVDVEALAAAALTDEPAAAAPVEQKFMDFPCSFCDEQIHISADMAGKQTPCPHCRRIVKVPLLAKEGPKDWRTVDKRLPSGAKREDGPAPEGAWGTASTAHVSTEALVEADAIPVVKERLTTRQWITRGLVAAGAVAAVVAIVLTVRHRKQESVEATALKEALAVADAKGNDALPAVESAELHRALGEYYLRHDRLDEGQRHFKQARALAMQLKSPPEHDSALIRIAASQVDMGGDGFAVKQKTRLSWNDTREEIKKTLLPLSLADSRAEAMRQVGGLLIDRGQANLNMPLANDLTAAPQERAELLAVIGLQLHQRTQDSLAQSYATRALQPYQTKAAAKPGDKNGKPPAASSLLALLLVLNRSSEAQTVALPPKPSDNIPSEVRTGYAEGLAWKDQWSEALALATAPTATTAHRLNALAAVAAVAASQDRPEAGQAIEAAAALATDPGARLASPWAIARVVQAGIRTEATANQLDALVKAVDSPEFQRDLQADIWKVSKASADPNQFAPGDNQKTWGPLWTEQFARQLAQQHKGAEVLAELQGWSAPTRALGFAGVALGVGDQG